MSDLVSILIPVFNREKLIEETLYSALSQTYSHIEVVVVDNCSTDQTWELIQAIANKDIRVKCLQNEENVGPVRNWKRCIDEATGLYGKILWSDDLIHEQFIEKTLPYLKNEDVGFVYTKTRIFVDGSGAESIAYHLGNTGLYDSEKYINGVVFGDNYPVSPGCAIFRLSDLKSNLLVNVPNSVKSDFSMHAIGNDLLLFLLAAEKYNKFAYVDEVISSFRAHSGSISTGSVDGKLVLHYALAKAYFIEEKRNNLIGMFNMQLKILLIRHRDSGRYGLNGVLDFYRENKNDKADAKLLLLKLKKRFNLWI
jgi:glycosyltransferase involved in cell wall biosynthesis